jgi:hypothetical protein
MKCIVVRGGENTMKTMKIIVALLLLVVVVSGFSTINASKGSDAREAEQAKYNYTFLSDHNATIPVDGTYEITLKLDQYYDLGGFLSYAADLCPDLIDSNVRISPDLPAVFYKPFKSGTWTGNIVNPSGVTSANYILHVA